MRRRKRSRWPCRMSSSGTNIVVSKYQIVQESDNEDFILPADKAPSRSVLERTQYNENINSLLLDRQSYVRCESNPMKRLTGEINATLFGMEKSGAISSIDRGMARAQEAALARFHGLPNVHTQRGRGSAAYGITKGHCKLRTGEAATPTSQFSHLRTPRTPQSARQGNSWSILNE